MAKKDYITRMISIDRRIIFLLLGLSVAAALVFRFNLPVRAGHFSSMFHDEMDKLKPGEVITIAGLYGPETAPEIQPMVKAAMRHAFNRGAKVVTLGIWPQTAPLLDAAVREVLREPKYAEMNLEYGHDFVHLGYMAGFMLVVRGMNRDIHETFPRDYYGTPIKDVPLMQRVHNFEDIAIAIEFASGGMSGSPIGSAWVMFAKPVNPEFRVLAGSTAVMAAEAYPYLQSGQIKGFLGGLKGAADYEWLLGLDLANADALKYMPAQSVAHILILLFIVIGNVGYILMRRREKGRRTSWN